MSQSFKPTDGEHGPAGAPREAQRDSDRAERWATHLAGVPERLSLSADRPRTEATQPSYAQHCWTLNGDLLARLEPHAGSSARPVTDRFLTALFALLHRYTGQEDLLVTWAGADEAASKDARQGMPIRLDCAGGPAIAELQRRVQQAVADASALGAVGIGALRKRLFVDGSPGESCVGQVVFAWGEESISAEAFACDLLWSFYPAPVPRSAALIYRSDLYDASTIEQMAVHLETVLLQLAVDPTRRLTAFPLVSEQEAGRVLKDLQRPTCDEASTGRLHDPFVGQAVREPDRTALVFGSEQMSYGELDRRSNQVGHYLQALGVGPDIVVGVAMERSCELAVALLGVLKAGGAYLPIDPALPSDRIFYMLEETAAPVVVTHPHIASQLAVPPACRQVVPLDSDGGPCQECATDAVRCAAGSENLSYVLYTSGSTGRPKGVMVSHSAAVHNTYWTNELYQVDSATRFVLKTPITFDVSVCEIFCPLWVGGTVVIAEPGAHRDPQQLHRLIESEKVSHAQFVPSLLRVFEELSPDQGATSLRFVIAAGEPLPADVVDRHYQQSASALINAYGPTEAFYVTEGRMEAGSPVTIGRPWPGMTITVANEDLELAPVGVAGELFIGGPQVARGYLGRPDLTAERFIPDPFGKRSGARLYRTGDLARFTSDGVIEFLGRIDTQTKIRGQRVELGEIEAAVRDHPQVQDAVALVHDGGAGPAGDRQRIVAYVVPTTKSEHAQTAMTSGLLEQLGSRLPGYMVPSAFVYMDEFPLLPNGKTNRRALPPPVFTRDVRLGPLVACRTPIEECLALMISELLEIDDVGAEDDFYLLGGNSLLALTLKARVAEILGIEDLPTRPFLGNLTAASLAATLIDTSADRQALEATAELVLEVASIPEGAADEPE